MTNKQITYRGQDILIGAGKGAYGVGRGHFIVIKESDRIRAFHILGVTSNDTLKKITMTWIETEIATTELKPLPEYYNADGSCKHIDKVIRTIDSTSSGFYNNTPYYSYDVFYDMLGTDKAGIVLYAIGVSRFFGLKYGVEILKITAEGYSFIQPITFDITHAPIEIIDEVESDERVLTITAIDGIAPFTYSSDGTNYVSTNTFTFTTTTIPNKIYVKDSLGTTASRTIELSNWNNNILP